MQITGSHDPALVALSILVAVAGSFTALDLGGRTRIASGLTRVGWLVAAAVALGNGIWSMHFVAMLAHSLPGTDVHYDVELTLLSLGLAIIVTGVGFVVIDRWGAAPRTLALSGTFMGAGIVAMHYTGMAAMQMRAELSYNVVWVSISVVVAVTAAAVALSIAFRNSGLLFKLLAAVVMGLAISGMHYAAMRAAVFTVDGTANHAQRASGIEQARLAFGVAGTTFAFLLLGMIAVAYDRRVSLLLKREQAAQRDSALADAHRRSEERLRLALRSGHIVAWEWSLEDDKMAWSDNVIDVLGSKFDVRSAFDQSIHPEDKERHRAALDKTSSAGVPYSLEMRFVQPDGAVIWVQEKAELLTDREGRRILSGVTIDITARVQLEEQLRQSQKMEAIGQLTGGVAHDFNNLLTIIKSSSDLLHRADVPDDRRRRYIEAIGDAVGRAAKITGQLLAFARRQTLKPELFDAAERVCELKEVLRRVLGEQWHIVVDVTDEDCCIEADLSQFETALVNIAANARDAMSEGGTLTVRVQTTSAGTPFSGAAPDGEFVSVGLSDTGCGIAADKLARIFEPFFTTKEVGKGTGLGLSQVYGFVKQSGGDVKVMSEVGRGTTFTLYLPRVAGSPVKQAMALDVLPLEDGHGGRLLLVEDNTELGAFSRQVLHDLGYATTLVANAEEALVLLAEQSGQFDAVFSDIVMPGMSGIDLAQEIRQRYSALPVVLTSGYSHVLAREGSYGFELVQKPYTAEDVSRVLRTVMQAPPCTAC